jgi:alpha-L-rhamnosidase
MYSGGVYRETPKELICLRNRCCLILVRQTMRLRLFSYFLAAIASLATAHALTVTDLRCERLHDPLGIDVFKPRFSWISESDARNQKQSAYEIIVEGQWDSGRVESDQSIFVEYGGKELLPATRYSWKVRVWDSHGQPSEWSKPAIFSTGLKEWSAKWIGMNKAGTGLALDGASWIWFPEGDPARNAPVATRYFRRTLTLPTGKISTSAICLASADNSFVLFVNGQKIGQGSDFKNPVALNMGPALHAGDNQIEITAANIGNDNPNPAGMIARLHIEFTEGAPIDLVTDEKWEASTDGNSWTSTKVLGPCGMGPWGDFSTDDRRLPARYLRREFDVTKKVARATAYVCGLGFFDLFLNGSKVSDDVMDPALSDYTKADYYVTFDVTTQVREGKNALGVILGNGRFFAPQVKGPASTQTFGFPKLLLQLEVEYTNGTKTTLISDENWKITDQGPIRTNNEYDGEEYDATMEMPGWDSPGFNDAKWDGASLVSAPGGQLKAQMMEPMRVVQTVHPVAITNPRPGTYIVDMGQNFYGSTRLKVSGPPGTQVRMISAYSVNPDGTIKTADNRSARCTDIYTLKGQGEEVWNPRFKGQGFRRVQLTGFPGTPRVDNFEGLVIHTAAEPAGEFQCSNDLVNRIHQAMWWGMGMFLRSAPLDPDRDERQAWTGDPAKDAESEAFNYNIAPFYAKWMDDTERSQRSDGSIPDITMIWNWGDGVEWPSVFTIIPDWFGDFYGDDRVAEDHYAAMKQWVLSMRRHEVADGTLAGTSYGDWCDTYTMGGKISDYGATPRELVSTAYQYHNCRIMAGLAKKMGKPEDPDLFDKMADKLKAAFNAKFLNPQTHVYQGGTQCADILALKFGLVPDDQRDAVITHLVDDILVQHQGHSSVGLVGMQWMMQTLTEIGRPDVAWTILTQTTRPSWGYMLSKGATTIWERWDMDTRDPGMNSEALLIQAGNVDAWFYQTLAGINPAASGFKKIVIKPSILGDLTWVKAHFDSPYGRIVSNWKLEGDKLTMDVTIPVNTTATVVLPGKNGGSHEVGSGQYRFVTQGPF